MFPLTTLYSVCNSQFPHHGESKSGCDGERGAGSSMILEKGISLAFAHDHGEDVPVAPHVPVLVRDLQLLVDSLDPFIAGFCFFLGSDMKGSSEIDRGFRVF